MERCCREMVAGRRHGGDGGEALVLREEFPVHAFPFDVTTVLLHTIMLHCYEAGKYHPIESCKANAITRRVCARKQNLGCSVFTFKRTLLTADCGFNLLLVVPCLLASQTNWRLSV